MSVFFSEYVQVTADSKQFTGFLHIVDPLTGAVFLVDEATSKLPRRIVKTERSETGLF